MGSRLRILCFCFIFFVFSLCFALKLNSDKLQPNVNDAASDVITVVIDAGHGGQDPGAVEGEVREADLNLAVAQKLRDKLVRRGFNVVMTRDSDEGLRLKEECEWEKTEDMKARKKIVSSSGGGIMLSIHQNYFSDKSAHGAQVFFSGGNAENEVLAQILQKKLADMAKSENTRTVMRNDELFMLKNNEMPSALIECGFLSNEEELTLLCDKTYQDELAYAMYEGVCEYFKVE